MPQLTRADTRTAEVVYVSAINLTTAAAIVGYPAYWVHAGKGASTVALYGIAVTDHQTGPLSQRSLAGIWAQAVDRNAYGLLQVWGYGDVQVATASTAPQQGDILCANSATALTGSTAGGLVVFVASAANATAADAWPHVLVLSAATAGTYSKGLIRCLH